MNSDFNGNLPLNDKNIHTQTVQGDQFIMGVAFLLRN